MRIYPCLPLFIRVGMVFGAHNGDGDIAPTTSKLGSKLLFEGVKPIKGFAWTKAV